jgi:hypothetical protein
LTEIVLDTIRSVDVVMSKQAVVSMHAVEMQATRIYHVNKSIGDSAIESGYWKGV